MIAKADLMANDWKGILLKVMCGWVEPFRFINPFNIQNVLDTGEAHCLTRRASTTARVRGVQDTPDVRCTECSLLCAGPQQTTKKPKGVGSYFL